jgi:hypothetical protein
VQYPFLSPISFNFVYHFPFDGVEDSSLFVPAVVEEELALIGAGVTEKESCSEDSYAKEIGRLPQIN